MKRDRIVLILLVLLCAGAAFAAADPQFRITADYNTPIDNNKIDPNLGVGAQYQFWGIFTLSAQLYTELVGGGTNILGISEIRPLGLFSGGLGMRIPLGGFFLTMDWQKFFTGTASNEGVYALSDSYQIGLAIDLSKHFGIEVYTRRLFAFTDRAIADPAFRVSDTEDTVQTIGIGGVFHLF